jgi:predicted acylesterase/phospholipase RssA
VTTALRSSRDALVLSGGGAKGAYEVGVLKALVNGLCPATGRQRLELDIFSGTSVGAFNASFLVARAGLPAVAAVDELEEVWRRRIAERPGRCGNGVFRVRGTPLDYVDPSCLARPFERFTEAAVDAGFWARYLAVRGSAFLGSSDGLRTRFLRTLNLASLFSPEPFHRLIRDTIRRRDLRASEKTLVVAATNWRDGTVELFSKRDLVDRVGPEGIAASASIPGIFPPVEIDGVPYHDGAVLLNTPLKPAIEAGADVIHVIYLDPEVADVPLRKVPNTLDTTYRMFLITSSALVNQDIAFAESIERELEIHRELGLVSEEMTELASEDARPGANSRVLRRLAEGRPYRPLTIHRYRPRSDFGGGAGLLDFRLRSIEQLIDAGFEDAKGHDCEKQGCVLPRQP